MPSFVPRRVQAVDNGERPHGQPLSVNLVDFLVKIGILPGSATARFVRRSETHRAKRCLIHSGFLGVRFTQGSKSAAVQPLPSLKR
jgi:hypothetical protein